MKYECSRCKAHEKLWRQYNTFLDNIKLLCRVCAEKEEGKKFNPDDSDFIGSLCPAIPSELPDEEWDIPKDESFWGYTSVPGWGVKWWYELPPFTKETPKWCLELTREQEEQKKRDDRAAWEARIDQMFKDTAFVVDAGEAGYHEFWKQWHSIVDVKQEDGVWETIGKHKRDPVCVNVSWLRVEGKLVAFYHATSNIINQDMVKKWVDKKFPVIKEKGYHNAHCGASDFYRCVYGVAPDWHKDPTKKKREELIRSAMGL